MIDPLLMLALAAGLSIVARLGVAAAEVWLLRARARLAATASQLPAGAEVGGSKDGTMWVVRNRGAGPAETAEEANGDR
jgi:hypothetical protein